MQQGDVGRRKTLDPKLDIVFWMLFGAEQNRELLISLLNAVLSPALPIEAVEVLPAQPERLAVRDKSISLDVRVRLHLELHLLELPKLASALGKNDEPTLALWGKFLSAVADEELEKLAMEHPVLKQAKAALDRLSADDVARLQAEQREMALLTFEAGMAAAREEAEQKGRQEGTAEVLLRLLTIKFGPQPTGIGERLARASQTELLRWSERVLSAETLDGVFASS